jgi:hypothetical protein
MTTWKFEIQLSYTVLGHEITCAMSVLQIYISLSSRANIISSIREKLSYFAILECNAYNVFVHHTPFSFERNYA